MSRERIAICRVCGIGDAVQMTPLLQQVRADRPDAEIFCFVTENAAPVLAGVRFVDHVVPLRMDWAAPAWTNPGLFRLWRHIAVHGPFDMLLCLGPYWRQNFLSLMVPAKVRSGFVTPGWKPLRVFTHPFIVPANAGGSLTHESLKYIELWCALAGSEDRRLGCDLGSLGSAASTIIAKLQRPYLCIAPGAGNAITRMDTKRWLPGHFVALMTMAIEDGYDVVVLGGKGDIEPALLPPDVLDLQGKTTLAQTAAVLRGSAGFLGNDSGIYHLALGLGVPAAAIFGPTSSRKTGPFRNPRSLVISSRLPCAPCLEFDCQLPADAHPGLARPACMATLQPASVWSQLRDFLGASNESAAAGALSATAASS